MSVGKNLVIIGDLFIFTLSLFDLTRYKEVRSRLNDVAIKISETVRYDEDYLKVIPQDITYLCLSGCKERIRKYRLSGKVSFVLNLAKWTISLDFTQIMPNK